MKIKLFISSFGGDTAWVSRHIKDAVTIQVGAACRSVSLDNVGGVTFLDNTGENISADNPYWGEFTGLYWIWKNIKFNDDDIVGFCHYNKMLDISERGIKKFFKKNPRGWITLPRDAIHLYSYDYPYNIAIEKILSQNFPNYYEQYKKLSSGEILFSSCQMFYTDVQ